MGESSDVDLADGIEDFVLGHDACEARRGSTALRWRLLGTAIGLSLIRRLLVIVLDCFAYVCTVDRVLGLAVVGSRVGLALSRESEGGRPELREEKVVLGVGFRDCQ